jgi:hypothetical protein
VPLKASTEEFLKEICCIILVYSSDNYLNNKI